MARSPTLQPETPSPTSATSPAHSSPRMSGAPGGGGYIPRRCITSARFTAVAATRNLRCPGAISGAATSPSRITDSSPNPVEHDRFHSSKPTTKLGPASEARRKPRRSAQRAARRAKEQAGRPKAASLRKMKGRRSSLERVPPTAESCFVSGRRPLVTC